MDTEVPIVKEILRAITARRLLSIRLIDDPKARLVQPMTLFEDDESCLWLEAFQESGFSKRRQPAGWKLFCLNIVVYAEMKPERFIVPKIMPPQGCLAASRIIARASRGFWDAFRVSR